MISYYWKPGFVLFLQHDRVEIDEFHENNPFPKSNMVADTKA